MFINNINGIINKNLSLFFFPSDIKLTWKSKQKQREFTKNQHFFISLFFFSKNSRFRETKNIKFWKETAFFGSSVDHFSNKPCYECFSIILKVAGRIFLRINFFIDTTQPTFQTRINVVSTFQITLEITLIRRWK